MQRLTFVVFLNITTLTVSNCVSSCFMGIRDATTHRAIFLRGKSGQYGLLAVS